MRDGSYGACAACGAQIGAARLKANPAAPRCVACQASDEARHGAHAPTL
jgi:RNA polymerase-binding transcription factor DksA